MSENETKQPKRQRGIINANTFLNVVIIGLLVWAGKRLESGDEKLTTISMKIAVMEESEKAKIDKMNQFQDDMRLMRSDISTIALDVARMKVNKP